MDTEFAIIGGGVVGLSIAFGLLKQGKSVSVLDEGDEAFRASRGNFGLVWVQGKGMQQPAYARWTRQSAGAWKGFADELRTLAGQDLALVQDGGFVIHMNEATLDSDRKRYEGLRDHLGGDYPFEVLGHNALKAEEPNIGPKVAGALYCKEDGHVNPLRLLYALATAVRKLGGKVHINRKVHDIAAGADGFEISHTGGALYAEKIILAAGLGAMQLGPKLGFKTNIRPQQGQILITEKIAKLIYRPNGEVRQVNEGGVQIGGTTSEAGLNDQEDITTMATLARRAVDIFPKLAQAKLLRCWAALRIMSPDGLPIYQQSETYPGAYFITCHSGVTLAAVHADILPRWIIDAKNAPEISAFSEARFDV